LSHTRETSLLWRVPALPGDGVRQRTLPPASDSGCLVAAVSTSILRCVPLCRSQAQPCRGLGWSGGHLSAWRALLQTLLGEPRRSSPTGEGCAKRSRTTPTSGYRTRTTLASTLRAAVSSFARRRSYTTAGSSAKSIPVRT
jgi:hypothetical protein